MAAAALPIVEYMNAHSVTAGTALGFKEHEHVWVETPADVVTVVHYPPFDTITELVALKVIAVKSKLERSLIVRKVKK